MGVAIAMNDETNRLNGSCEGRNGAHESRNLRLVSYSYWYTSSTEYVDVNCTFDGIKRLRYTGLHRAIYSFSYFSL